MPDIAKIPLSASTHGRGVLVVATVIGSGTTIHTAVATTTAGQGDDVTLYAHNSHSAAVTLQIGFGGVTDPDDLIEMEIASNTFALVIPGLLLRNGLIILAAAGTASVVTIVGYAIRAN